MNDETYFLIEEYKSLKEEIRMRQGQILEVEKGLMLFLAAIYSFIFFKTPDASVVPAWFLQIVLAAVAPLATLLAMMKIGQNVSRVLEISDYIKTTEVHFLKTENLVGYEHTLRPNPSVSMFLRRRFGAMLTRRAEFLLFLAILIFTAGVCGTIVVLVLKG